MVMDPDRATAAAYIASFLPELKRLADSAGFEVLGYLLNLAEAEAKELCAQQPLAPRSRRVDHLVRKQ